MTGRCWICEDERGNDWPPLCSTAHCTRCTRECGICQDELHDGWDA